MNTYYIKKNDKEVQICNREFEEVVQLFRIVEESNFEKSDHYKVVDWFGDKIIASVYYNNWKEYMNTINRNNIETAIENYLLKGGKIKKLSPAKERKFFLGTSIKDFFGSNEVEKGISINSFLEENEQLAEEVSLQIQLEDERFYDSPMWD